MERSAIRNTLLLLALFVAVAIGAVSGATTGQRQVGGFVAQTPPQTAAPTQPVQSQRHRHLSARAGVAITSRLEPQDQVVEIIREGTPFNDPISDPETAVRIFTSMAPAVAVIGVGKKESAFSGTAVPTSFFYSPEDWITTTLTADVRSVLKDTTGRLEEGGVIQILESGGEMVLADGRRIIARESSVRQTTIGGTYLAFLFLEHTDGPFLFGGLSSVEIDNGVVKRMRRDAPPESGLETRSPEWVIQQVRAHARRQP